MKRFKLLFPLFLLTIISASAQKIVRVKLIGAETKEPLPNAVAILLQSNTPVLSDKNGLIEATENTRVEISVTGYETKRVNPSVTYPVKTFTAKGFLTAPAKTNVVKSIVANVPNGNTVQKNEIVTTSIKKSDTSVIEVKASNGKSRMR